jgi:hypothetical protein
VQKWLKKKHVDTHYIDPGSPWQNAYCESFNSIYSARIGKDFFKPTTDLMESTRNVAIRIQNIDEFRKFIESLYKIFHEGPGGRLENNIPESFKDVNTIRTLLEHDLDHGKEGRVSKKRAETGSCVKKYSGAESPKELDAGQLSVTQANLLRAIKEDLEKLDARISTGESEGN